ncbi:TPA: EamA family transporter [Legionella pneumophila]|uniref:EamA family transporter n=1 Tax=Legionella pneumophila TaxID=446 RepID=UPI000789A652|nr:EamA family transporter [Legionella pneumophila]HAT1882194.1 EamA family transporter [Legionella pneumophila]HAT2113111.1 EamA family transporter [Legionella pneumophila]HAT8720724.1 EamA family transporter [Legionella pneumophila]HAU1193292.1 EamA family transporter [Legionella pneumophila]HBD7103559.1 EamA family transporter [Legionella pneumophila]
MNFSTWYFPSLAALFLYGAWGYWGTRAANFINPLSITFYSSIGVLISGMIALILLDFKPELSVKGSTYGLLNGLANGIACIFFILALRNGPTMPVVLVTSMYPMITLIFCMIFLKQELSIKQGLGMVFALTALILFSIE